MRDNNDNVIRRFVSNKETGIKGYGNVSSKNNALYSYNAKVAEWENGELLVYDGWDGYSSTTSKVMGKLLRYIENYGIDYVATNKPKGKDKVGKNRF